MAEGGWRRTLVIMVRRPVAGTVKTRLAQRIGTVEALRFYRVVTARLLREIGRDRRWRTVLAVTPDRARMDRCWPADMTRIPQGGGDLEVRLRRLFDTMPRGSVIVVGSDIPNIRAIDIAAAFGALGAHDAVLGPAEDGGYWLVGLKRQPATPKAFGNVRWSTGHALADTVRNLGAARIGYVRTHFDVDTREDWMRWLRAVGTPMAKE
ncbi:MAG: TIGR04282 family arsenosugar biosynthesis glycosyltransferase, partial [Stellaceae bacterium]